MMKGQHEVPFTYQLLSSWEEVLEDDPSFMDENGNVPDDAPKVKTFIYLQDPAFAFLIILPLVCVGIIGLGVSIVGASAATYIPLPAPWPAIIATLVWIAIVVLCVWICVRYVLYMFEEYFPTIPPAYITMRQLWGRVRYFRNCRIFSYPGLTRVVFIPGDLELSLTTSSQRDDNAITSFILMDDGKSSDEMLFVVQAIFRMDTTRPYLLTRAFVEEFEEFGIEGIEEEEWDDVVSKSKKKVVGKILQLIQQTISAHADEALQTFRLTDVRTNIQEVNKKFTKRLRGPLCKIAVEVVKLTIVRTIELDENGPISQHERATREEQLGLARARIAQADERARIAEANADKGARIGIAQANQDAQEKEQAARQAIAGFQHEAQIALLKLQKKIAETDQQELIARLKVFKGKAVQVVLSQLEALQPEQYATVLNNVAQNLGMKPQTLVNLGSDLLKGHPITAVVEEFLKVFSLFNKGDINETPEAAAVVTPPPTAPETITETP